LAKNENRYYKRGTSKAGKSCDHSKNICHAGSHPPLSIFTKYSGDLEFFRLL